VRTAAACDHTYMNYYSAPSCSAGRRGASAATGRGLGGARDSSPFDCDSPPSDYGSPPLGRSASDEHELLLGQVGHRGGARGFGVRGVGAAR
jgi:hypothetical protein